MGKSGEYSYFSYSLFSLFFLALPGAVLSFVYARIPTGQRGVRLAVILKRELLILSIGLVTLGALAVFVCAPGKGRPASKQRGVGLSASWRRGGVARCCVVE